MKTVRDMTAGVLGLVLGFGVVVAAQGDAAAPLPGPSVLAPGAQVEKLAGDFIFTEGPTSDRKGNVYFVDQDNNRIMEWTTDGKLSTWMQPSNYSNGMTTDWKGHLYATADLKNEMWRIDLKTKKVTPLFNTYDGKLLNGPNDVWVQPTTGRVYFTDPYYRRKWWTRGPSENPQGAYVYLPDQKKLVRVIDDMQQANGIIGTPDGKKLYVADIRGRQTFVYDINADGTLGNKTLFCESGSDGMTIDSEGNVYLSSGRAVQVYDKTGKHIESIPVPEVPSNMCFGGKDMKTLFITARTGFYAVKTRVKGVGPQ
ncbi:MAG TPA: SMP-30/gluconolactonase/LRE family protein [Vicinamibacterales bacterium]|nr:SMP-30/gluconolactonase/LRE family protein [Vicinamibacterales bacterium]